MSEPTDVLKDVRQHLNERARARRPELERERARLNHVLQRNQLVREVRECGQLVHRWPDGLIRLWPDFGGDWSLAAAACGEGEREGTVERAASKTKRAKRTPQAEGGKRGKGWAELNRRTCKVWVRRWMKVAWLIRQKRLVDVVLDAQPDEPIDLLTHGLFVQLLGATDWRRMQVTGRSVAAELARVRSELARMASPELPDVHFELGNYFERWLCPRVDAALRTRMPSDNAGADPRYSRARASLEWALSLHPEWEGNLGKVYAFLRSSGECPAYSEHRLPAIETWRRYARQSRPGASG